MQTGYIYKERGKWRLRWWEPTTNGERMRRFTTLAPVGEDYPTKASVKLLAQKQLEALNAGRTQPESLMPVKDFIENHYLPDVKANLRASTYKDYKDDIYERHLVARLGSVKLRDFRTVNAQRLIADIHRDNPEIGHKTLLRIKSFLSGTFRYARTEGLLDDNNPVRDVTLPRGVRRKKFIGATYTVPEISKMLATIAANELAVAVVATAAFTGLRYSELRGLQWGDYDEENQRLHVRRTMWRTQMQGTKTESSEASVPVLPILKMFIEYHRNHLTGYVQEGDLGKTLRPTDWMFAGERRNTSLNLANLVRRTINPMLKVCVCGVESRHHKNLDHEFELDSKVPQWRGWHSFRRSLASNLYALGVKPALIQAILRHADIHTTMTYYVEVNEQDVKDALAQLNSLMR
jgi:integrase